MKTKRETVNKSTFTFAHVVPMSFMNSSGMDSEIIQVTECFVTLIANVIFYAFMNCLDMIPQAQKCSE